MGEWLLYREDDGIVGPVDSRLVLDGIADGRVPPDTKVRALAETAWRPLSDIPVFGLALRGAPPRDPMFPRAPFEGFEEAAAQQHSLRPHVHESSAWEAARSRPPMSRRQTAGAAMGAGAALGLAVVLIASRAIPALDDTRPPVARASMRTLAATTSQRAIDALTSSHEELPVSEAAGDERDPVARRDEPRSESRRPSRRLPPPPKKPPVRRMPLTDPGF